MDYLSTSGKHFHYYFLAPTFQHVLLHIIQILPIWSSNTSSSWQSHLQHLLRTQSPSRRFILSKPVNVVANNYRGLKCLECVPAFVRVFVRAEFYVWARLKIKCVIKKMIAYNIIASRFNIMYALLAFSFYICVVFYKCYHLSRGT